MREFNYLPKEIMLDILTRLPTESALDSKLVCKPWRDVLGHQFFPQMHLNRLNSDDKSGKLSFLFLTYVQGVREFYYTEYDENCSKTPFSRRTRVNLNLPLEDYRIAGSYNGLICFDSSYKATTCICNPITREYVILPTSKGKYKLSGFGYILSTNEYKVVRIIEHPGGDSDGGIVQVYTLGSGTGWRDAGRMDVNMPYVIPGCGKFADGALHWVDIEGTIHAFNLTDEKFSKLPSPPFSPQPAVPNFAITLGVLGDSLSATYCADHIRREIWLLKKNKNNFKDLSWIKEFSFFGYLSPPFEITKTGRLLCYENQRIYSYDPEASSAKRVINFGKSISRAIPHKNTLVSLKLLGEKHTKTMEVGERAISDEVTENNAKRSKRSLAGTYVGAKGFQKRAGNA